MLSKAFEDQIEIEFKNRTDKKHRTQKSEKLVC